MSQPRSSGGPSSQPISRRISIEDLIHPPRAMSHHMSIENLLRPQSPASPPPHGNPSSQAMPPPPVPASRGRRRDTGKPRGRPRKSSANTPPPSSTPLASFRGRPRKASAERPPRSTTPTTRPPGRPRKTSNKKPPPSSTPMADPQVPASRKPLDTVPPPLVRDTSRGCEDQTPMYAMEHGSYPQTMPPRPSPGWPPDAMPPTQTDRSWEHQGRGEPSFPTMQPRPFHGEPLGAMPPPQTHQSWNYQGRGEPSFPTMQPRPFPGEPLGAMPPPQTQQCWEQQAPGESSLRTMPTPPVPSMYRPLDPTAPPFSSGGQSFRTMPTQPVPGVYGSADQMAPPSSFVGPPDPMELPGSSMYAPPDPMAPPSSSGDQSRRTMPTQPVSSMYGVLVPTDPASSSVDPSFQTMPTQTVPGMYGEPDPTELPVFVPPHLFTWLVPLEGYPIPEDWKWREVPPGYGPPGLEPPDEWSMAPPPGWGQPGFEPPWEKPPWKPPPPKPALEGTDVSWTFKPKDENRREGSLFRNTEILPPPSVWLGNPSTRLQRLRDMLGVSRELVEYIESRNSSHRSSSHGHGSSSQPSSSRHPEPALHEGTAQTSGDRKLPDGVVLEWYCRSIDENWDKVLARFPKKRRREPRLLFGANINDLYPSDDEDEETPASDGEPIDDTYSGLRQATMNLCLDPNVIICNGPPEWMINLHGQPHRDSSEPLDPGHDTESMDLGEETGPPATGMHRRSPKGKGRAEPPPEVTELPPPSKRRLSSKGKDRAEPPPEESESPAVSNNKRSRKGKERADPPPEGSESSAASKKKPSRKGKERADPPPLEIEDDEPNSFYRHLARTGRGGRPANLPFPDVGINKIFNMMFTVFLEFCEKEKQEKTPDSRPGPSRPRGMRGMLNTSTTDYVTMTEDTDDDPAPGPSGRPDCDRRLRVSHDPLDPTVPLPHAVVLCRHFLPAVKWSLVDPPVGEYRSFWKCPLPPRNDGQDHLLRPGAACPWRRWDVDDVVRPPPKARR
ncbi:hypothetical protein LTS17_008567 [Exophiala oligosperma]